MKKSAAQVTSTPKSTDKTLVVVAGPTGCGKTNLSIELAGHLQTEIVSADARQFYHELKIGTAAPTPPELALAKHHLAGHLSVYDYYNVSAYEQQAIAIINQLFKNHDFVLLTGGSGLYIDAVCKGIDDLPPVDPEIRKEVDQIFRHGGLQALRGFLKNADPVFYQQVDLANPNRMKRAIEVFLTTGKKISELRTHNPNSRPFKIKTVVVDRPRPELFGRINARVDQMVVNGLIEEAIGFFRLKHLNALNTVGYKEIFDWISGKYKLSEAVEKIKTNTRRYAKRQITWFKRYPDALWVHPGNMPEILRFIEKKEVES